MFLYPTVLIVVEYILSLQVADIKGELLNLLFFNQMKETRKERRYVSLL